jgi:hypothetical protein
MDGALVGRSYAYITNSDLPSLLVQRVARLRSQTTDQCLLGFWMGSEKFVRPLLFDVSKGEAVRFRAQSQLPKIMTDAAVQMMLSADERRHCKP